MTNIFKDSREPSPALALRAPEAAQALGISERSLRSLTKSGVIPHVRLGHSVVWPVELLNQFLREQAQRGTATGAGTEWVQPL